MRLLRENDRMSERPSDLLGTVIEALAESVVQEYLTGSPATDQETSPSKAERVPLAPVDRAA